MNQLNFSLYIPELKTHANVRVLNQESISVIVEGFSYRRVEYSSFRGFYKPLPTSGEWTAYRQYEAWDTDNTKRTVYSDDYISEVYLDRKDKWSTGKFKESTYDQRKVIYLIVKKHLNQHIKENKQLIREARILDEQKEKERKINEIERKRAEIEKLNAEIAELERAVKAS